MCHCLTLGLGLALVISSVGRFISFDVQQYRPIHCIFTGGKCRVPLWPHDRALLAWYSTSRVILKIPCVMTVNCLGISTHEPSSLLQRLCSCAVDTLVIGFRLVGLATVLDSWCTTCPAMAANRPSLNVRTVRFIDIAVITTKPLPSPVLNNSLRYMIYESNACQTP